MATPRRRLRVNDPNFAVNVLQQLQQVDASENDDVSEDETLAEALNDSPRPGPSGQFHDHDWPSSPEPDDTEYFPREESDTSDGSSSEDEVRAEPSQPNFYTSKSGMRWSSKEPGRVGRPPSHNILRGTLPGLTQYALHILGESPSELDVWKQLFDDEMVENILNYTNIHLEGTRESVSASNIRNYYEISMNEIRAFIGLLLLSSIYKSNHESAKSLFATGFKGRPLFRATMSYRRFIVIKEALRFDDPATRKERRINDPAAPISELFTKFIANSQRMYSVSDRACVDESLIPFRGRVQFRVYMPNKPGRYGIKLMCLTDARTSYCYNSYIYTGKGSDGRFLSNQEKKLQVPTQALLTITRPIQESRRNVTADNWFSSIEAVRELKARGLTYVGTMRKNKKELPPQFTSKTGRAINDKLYGFSEDGEITLFSSRVKQNKVINIVSSMHHSKGVDGSNGKSEINQYYNETKGGVDSLDYKCVLYSTQRKDDRWPLCVFSGMLNIGNVNSFILHKCYETSPLEPRFKFIEKLGLQMIEPHLRDRLSNIHINKEVKTWIRKILGEQEPVPNFDGLVDKLEKKERCRMCSYKKDRKTNYKCAKCDTAVCMEHSKRVCGMCLQSRE